MTSESNTKPLTPKKLVEITKPDVNVLDDDGVIRLHTHKVKFRYNAAGGQIGLQSVGGKLSVLLVSLRTTALNATSDRGFIMNFARSC